jgi:hypothetical protein
MVTQMIRAIIKDKDALCSIKEDAIHMYLQTHGFTYYQKRPLGYEYRYKKLDDDGDPILACFAEESASDYGLRVGDIIRMMSQLEDRSELDIFVEMGGKLS